MVGHEAKTRVRWICGVAEMGSAWIAGKLAGNAGGGAE